MKAKANSESKIGGFVFLFSLIALSCLIALLSFSFLLLPPFTDPWSALATFASAALVGGVLSALLIRGRISIFIHELKHSIVSNLVGNKAKRLKVSGSSGSFEYMYSRDTAHMNAFIALAPYCLPLLTLSTLIIGVIFLRDQQNILAAILSATLGFDLVLNFRDAGPHQTDFSQLIGGFVLGFYYTLLANLLFVILVLTYQAGGLELLLTLFNTCFELMKELGTRISTST